MDNMNQAHASTESLCPIESQPGCTSRRRRKIRRNAEFHGYMLPGCPGWTSSLGCRDGNPRATHGFPPATRPSNDMPVWPTPSTKAHSGRSPR